MSSAMIVAILSISPPSLISPTSTATQRLPLPLSRILTDALIESETETERDINTMLAQNMKALHSCMYWCVSMKFTIFYYYYH